MQRTDQCMFDIVFLTVSCLTFIKAVSGFVGSSFLGFRRLFPDLRALIGTLLYALPSQIASIDGFHN
jgi:hypothetical protein